MSKAKRVRRSKPKSLPKKSRLAEAERKKAQAEMQTRATQQAVVARLGQLALGGCDLNELFNEAVKGVAQTLNVEYCKVLELLPGEKELLLRAGVGWKEGLVGHATVGTGTDSQAGYTLSSEEPVIVEDLTTEKRFSGPPLLHDHRVVSGMSVIISGYEKPFGVLGAHTTRRRTFTKDDINFLQSVANVLAGTIERMRAEDAVKAERKRFIDVLEKLPAYLVLLTPDYHVSYANRFFRERFGEDQGRRCFEYLFGRTEPCETCETYKTLKNMAPLEWEWTGPDGHNYYIFDSPFTDVDGSTLIMEVGIDITDRKKAEEALRRAHEELETHVEERTKDLTEATMELEAEVIERRRVEENLRQTRDYLESLFNYANAPIICWEAEFKITRFNQAFEHLTGYKAEEVIGKDLGVLFPEKSKEESLIKIQRTLTERWEVVEIPIRRKDSEERVVLWNSANIYAADRKTLMATIAQGQDITERKKAEEEVRSLSRFPAENPNVVLRISNDGKILYSNEAGLVILNEWKTQVGQAAPNKWCQLVADVFKSGIRKEFEEGYGTRTFLIMLAPIAEAGYVNVYGQDITERKKAEETLQETRNYLENLIDYANAPIIVWNPTYRITRFNHAFERLTGHKVADVLGKPLEILFPEDSKEESLRHISRASSGEYWQVVEIPILRTDGNVRTVLWNSANIYGKDGTTVVATIAQGQDITERKKAEQSLRESQTDLNRAQAVAKTGSWRLDVQRNELLWSDETYRMFGIRNGTPLTYETFLSFVHPDDRGYVDEKWNAAMHGEPYDIEHRIVVEGAVRWVREKAELEFGKDGVLRGGFGTVQEITEIKEMQAKLEEYSQHLERLVDEKTQKLKEVERLATIGETAGMVGHDIRNPLQSIEGAVYLAKEEIKTIPAESQERKELEEILDIIQNQTNYIDHIVAELQDFARTPMPQPREADIQQLVIESLSMLEIPEKVEVQTAFQEDLSKLTVDPVFMKRVIVNLIENAVHAMPNGGKLTLRVFCDEESTYICVEDTGVGIAEEHKPKIFSPLFTTKAKGQGIGLSVCKKLVEAHDGEITFESKPGNTIFKIKLPMGRK